VPTEDVTEVTARQRQSLAGQTLSCGCHTLLNICPGLEFSKPWHINLDISFDKYMKQNGICRKPTGAYGLNLAVTNGKRQF